MYCWRQIHLELEKLVLFEGCIFTLCIVALVASSNKHANLKNCFFKVIYKHVTFLQTKPIT